MEEQGTWASRTQKHSEAGYGQPVDRGAWTAKTVKRPRQQPAHPQYANYWAPLTRKRHTMPHSAQPQHTNYWAPRTRKRHQQEHRPQRPTESSNPAQHAKGRTGDCPGPCKGTTTRRNVTQGGVGRLWPGSKCPPPPPRSRQQWPAGSTSLGAALLTRILRNVLLHWKLRECQCLESIAEATARLKTLYFLLPQKKFHDVDYAPWPWKNLWPLEEASDVWAPKSGVWGFVCVSCMGQRLQGMHTSLGIVHRDTRGRCICLRMMCICLPLKTRSATRNGRSCCRW